MRKMDRPRVVPDRRDKNASKMKPGAHKHTHPDDYLACLDLNNKEQEKQQQQVSRAQRAARVDIPRRKTINKNNTLNIGGGRQQVAEKPSALKYPNIPPGSRIIGGLIIPPFFSLSMNFSKAKEQEVASPNPTPPVGNFFGNLLNKIKSPAKLFRQDVVNEEHEIDVVTGTRLSIKEEERKAKAFLDSYLADCLMNETTSIYTPEEKIQMRTIHKNLACEKEEERMKEREKEEKEQEKQQTKRDVKLGGKYEGREGKRKGKDDVEIGRGCGDEAENSTLGTTDLSNQHPLFARGFREKVRKYTRSGSEVSVDSNSDVSKIDDDFSRRSRRRPKDDNDRALGAAREENKRRSRKLRRQVSLSKVVERRRATPPRAAAEQPRRQRSRHRDDQDDDEMDLSSRTVMKENRKILPGLQIDEAREAELNKLIIEENKRTLKLLRMEDAKEKLRLAPNVDADSTTKKTQSGGSTLTSEPIESSSRSSNGQSNTGTDTGISTSVSRRSCKKNRNERRDEKSPKKPEKIKACSTDTLLTKRTAEHTRKTESQDRLLDSVVEPTIKEETETRHKDKTVVVEARRKDRKQPEVKNVKTKRPEPKKSNTTRSVDSELDDNSETDDVQLVFHNKHLLEGKSDTKKSSHAKPQVTTQSIDVRGTRQHRNRMRDDVQKCSRNVNREYIEQDRENDIESWLEKNCATEDTFTESVDYYDRSSRRTVVIGPREEVVNGIPMSKEGGRRHEYYYADQRDSRDYIYVENANLRGIMKRTTTTCEREECIPFQGHHREDYRYGDVRLEDDVIWEEKERKRVKTPSSTDEESSTVNGYAKPAPPYASKTPGRRCVNKKRADSHQCQTVLTRSQENMAEVNKHRSNAVSSRRVYLTNRRKEAMEYRQDAGRRPKGSNVTTALNRRQSQEYRETFEVVQSKIVEWDQVLEDGEHAKRDARALEVSESHSSVVEALKAISEDDTSSSGVKTSTEGGLRFGSETGVLLPGFDNRVVPRARKVGLVVARPKPSFQGWSKHKDDWLKVKEIKDKNNARVPEGRFVKHATILEEDCPTDWDVSSQVVVKPKCKIVEEDVEKKVGLVSNVDDTKEEARAMLLGMLKKVHVKAEKLGRIRKLMEVMEEYSEIGDAPKRDILADMLLAINLEGKDESANVIQGMEHKRDDHNVKVANNKRTSSKSPDARVQMVEPVMANQHTKCNKHSKSLDKKHEAFKEHPQLGPPPIEHKTRNIQEDGKIHRGEEKDNIVGMKESFEKVSHTDEPFKYNSSRKNRPNIGEDVLKTRRMMKPRGSGRFSYGGRRTTLQSIREERVEEATDSDASKALSPRRPLEGGDDNGRRSETNREQKVEELLAYEESDRSEFVKANEVIRDRALECGKNNSMSEQDDSLKTRQEPVSEITSCFNNIRSRQMQEHMARVLADYLAKKQELKQLVKEEKLCKQREARCDNGRGNNDSSVRREVYGDVAREILPNLESCGDQVLDDTGINEYVDIEGHVATCYSTHSVRCDQVEGVVVDLESNRHIGNTLSGRSVDDYKRSAQETYEMCEHKERARRRKSTTYGTGMEPFVLPSVLSEKENIIHLRHNYVKPVKVESDKPMKSCNIKCDDETPEKFTEQDPFKEDCVVKTCNGGVSKQAWPPSTENHMADEPRGISLMEPGSHFQHSLNAVDEIHENPERDVLNDHFKLENSAVRQFSVDKSERNPALNKVGRVSPQRLASHCEGDHNCATPVGLTVQQDGMPRQQMVDNVNPTSEHRMKMALRDVNPTSSDTTQHSLEPALANNVREGLSRVAERAEEIHSDDIIECRRDGTSTQGDSSNILPCIDTTDKAMEVIFKKMDEVIMNRFLTLASINDLKIVVTPQLVVEKNSDVSSDEFKNVVTEEKREEITKEEFECEQSLKKEKQRSRVGIVTIEDVPVISKEVVSKRLSANDKSEMFPTEVCKNEPEVTKRHQGECPTPGDRGTTTDRPLMDRMVTVINNQERMQELALRNSHQLEAAATAMASCHFKRSDVRFIRHMLSKSTGAIKREKKQTQMRLRRSKTTKTRSKPWRVERVNEARHGDPAATEPRRQVSASQQVVTETSADLRLLEKIALINVPDNTPVAPKRSDDFDQCFEQVHRCLPDEKHEGNKVFEKKRSKVSSKASVGVKTRKRDGEVPADRLLERVRNNLDEDELEMLELASRSRVNVLAERREYTKDVDVIYRSGTYDESNSTSTDVATPSRKTIAEVDDSGHENLLSICENVNELTDRLTSSEDVFANTHAGRRERERSRGGSSHLKDRHEHRERKGHRIRREDRKRYDEEESEEDEKTTAEATRKPHTVSKSDRSSKRRRNGTTTTTTTSISHNAIPSHESSFESNEVWKDRRLSDVIDIDEWIRDGAVAMRGSTRQEENFVVPVKSKKSSKNKRTEKFYPVEKACTPFSKFVHNYALQSGIILDGAKTTPYNNNNDDDDNCCCDNAETLIMIRMPEEDEFKVKRKSSTPAHSGAQIVHVDSDEIVLLGTETTEAALPWSRAEQEAFGEALKRHAPTPRVWDRIAQSVGRSKRDCVLHFMRIWTRLEGEGADGRRAIQQQY